MLNFGSCMFKLYIISQTCLLGVFEPSIHNIMRINMSYNINQMLESTQIANQNECAHHHFLNKNGPKFSSSINSA